MGWYGRNGSRSKLTNSIFSDPYNRPLVDGKKVKEVYSNDGLCHAWASGNVPRGRSHNMFFEFGVIYSFGNHYKAAKIHTNKKTGAKLVLTNQDGYSTTTREHLWSIAKAVKHLNTLDVVYVEPCSKEDHAENVRFLFGRVSSAIERGFLLKGWADSGDVRDFAKSLNQYVEFFDLKNQGIDLESEEFEMTMMALDQSVELRSKKNREREDRQKARDEAKALELNATHAPRIQKINEEFPSNFEAWRDGEIDSRAFDLRCCFGVDIPGPFGHSKRVILGVSKETLEAYRSKIQDVLRSHYEEDLADWKAGGNSGEMTSSLYLCGIVFKIDIPELDLIRITGNKIETTQHADVPLEHGLRLVRKILSREAKRGERVGHYNLESVKCDKKDCIVKIGCHTFSLNECLEVLKPYLNRENIKLVPVQEA